MSNSQNTAVSVWFDEIRKSETYCLPYVTILRVFFSSGCNRLFLCNLRTFSFSYVICVCRLRNALAFAMIRIIPHISKLTKSKIIFFQGKFYMAVIEDVMTSVREMFQDDGVDEQILLDLKATWMRKLKETKSVEPNAKENETTAPAPAPTSGTGNSRSKASRAKANQQQKEQSNTTPTPAASQSNSQPASNSTNESQNAQSVVRPTSIPNPLLSQVVLDPVRSSLFIRWRKFLKSISFSCLERPCYKLSRKNHDDDATSRRLGNGKLIWSNVILFLHRCTNILS